MLSFETSHKFTKAIFLYKQNIESDFLLNVFDALRDFVPFANFKNVKNTHGGVLLLIKLHSSMGALHVF